MPFPTMPCPTIPYHAVEYDTMHHNAAQWTVMLIRCGRMQEMAGGEKEEENR